MDIEENIPPLRRWFRKSHNVTYPNRANAVTKFFQSESQKSEKIESALSQHLVNYEIAIVAYNNVCTSTV